jgi:hypothetical protein
MICTAYTHIKTRMRFKMECIITHFKPSSHHVYSYYFLYSLGTSSHKHFTSDTRGSTESSLWYHEDTGLAKRMTTHLINTRCQLLVWLSETNPTNVKIRSAALQLSVYDKEIAHWMWNQNTQLILWHLLWHEKCRLWVRHVLCAMTTVW